MATISGAALSRRNLECFCGPAYVVFEAGGHGEFALGAIQAGMDLQYGKRTVLFAREGFGEMDATSGTGSAEFGDDGTAGIELSFHNGEDAILRAVHA